MKIKDARSLPNVAQEDIRKKAVKAVNEGMTQVEAAKLFGVTRQAVGKWMKAYREGGEKALKRGAKGRPKGGSLLPWQAAQTARAITDRNPEQLKLPYFLWTREAVAKLIERRYGIRLSQWTAGRYLAKWGFTPQKPVRRAFEQKPEEVKKWLNQAYPAIRTKAKRENAQIYWGDEMGMRSDHAVGTSYGRRGETPVVPGTGQRFGCNMVSAINNKGKMYFMVFKKRFSAGVFVDFLARLVRQARHKVFLIIDRHPVHKSKTVANWLEKNRRLISVFFLPGYSPELNPDEMLNQDVKANAVGRQRAASQNELIGNVRNFLRSRQRKSHVVRSYFREKHVLYAAY